METSNCELLPEVESKVVASNENCRLRHGLNVNCLLHVFDYLNESDLIQVCKLDNYFKELITKWTLKKKLLDLKELAQEQSEESKISCVGDVSQCFEILETFGKSMQRFQLFTNNFTLVLQTIIKYCEPAKLTEIEIEYHSRIGEVDLDVMNLSMPFLSNLRTFTFSADNADAAKLNEFLVQLAITASNFQILALVGIAADCEYLNKMHNLRELQLCDATPGLSVISIDGLTSGLRKLKVFTIGSYQNIATIGDALWKHCPNLKEFNDCHLENPYKRFDLDLINRYNFLSSFRYLNSVTLTSYTFCGCDLYYPLTTLATTNIVKLKVFVNSEKPIFLSEEVKALIMRRSLPNFAYLQTVEIKINVHIPNGEWFMDGSIWTQCDLRCQFIFHFVSQLKNLKCVRFLGMYQTNMYKILEFTPNIQTLDICQTREKVPPEEIQNIVKILRTVRRLNDGGNEHKLLYLIVNAHSKFYNYSDFEDVMNISYRTAVVAYLFD